MIITQECVSLWISLGFKVSPYGSSVLNSSLVMLTMLSFLCVYSMDWALLVKLYRLQTGDRSGTRLIHVCQVGWTVFCVQRDFRWFGIEKVEMMCKVIPFETLWYFIRQNVSAPKGTENEHFLCFKF